MKKKTVIARDLRQAREYAREQKLSIGEWRYASSPEMLQGLEFAPGDVVALPGWDARRKPEEVQRFQEMIATRTRL